MEQFSNRTMKDRTMPSIVFSKISLFLKAIVLVVVGSLNQANAQSTSWTTGTYGNNQSFTRPVTVPGASRISYSIVGVTEANFDFVSVRDARGNVLVSRLSGQIAHSGVADGDTVYVTFTSDYSVVKSGFTVRVSNLAPATGAGSLLPSPTTQPTVFSVVQIPSIMRALGWSTAADWMDRWFYGDGTNLVLPFSQIAALDSEVQRSAQQWNADSSFLNRQGVRDELIRGLRREVDSRGVSVLVRGGSYDFISKELTAAGNTFDTVEGEMAKMFWIDQVNTGSRIKFILSGLQTTEAVAAVDRGTVRLVPSGQVIVSGDRAIVTINRLAVYFRDAYEFDGWQPLGCWTSYPPGATAAALPFSSSNCVYNSNFRAWRDQNPTRGKDFRIFSQMTDVPMRGTLSFQYTLNEQELAQRAGNGASTQPSSALAAIQQCLTKFSSYFGIKRGNAYECYGEYSCQSTSGALSAIAVHSRLAQSDFYYFTGGSWFSYGLANCN